MLKAIGPASRRALVDAVVPRAIARERPMKLPAPVGEAAALAELKAIARRNTVLKSCIGQGYHGTHTPSVILRNVLENPAWYTAYTPYQAEISQGRLEALINFQTMVRDLTALDIAGSSMLDEATAAAEAMALALRVGKSTSRVFFVADDVLPQTLDVVRTRAEPLGVEVRVGAFEEAGAAGAFAVLLQYPGVTGAVRDLAPVIDAVHAGGGLAIVAADLLALALLKPPGEMGADIAVGTTQRFGMPMCNGGPHAGYLATKDAFKRSLPGRLVGASVDAHGALAYRLALQTREQHIRREKATSNICTAQVLPAVVASMYAVYHGAEGLRRIAGRVAAYTAVLAAGLRRHRLDARRRRRLRHPLHRHRRAHRRAAARRPRGRLQPAPRVGREPRRHARRDDDARRHRGTLVGLRRRRRRGGVSGGGRLRGRRRRAAGARGAAAHQRLPGPSGLRQLPQRDGHDALPAPSRRQGPGARPQHDPARLVHHEAQRGERDDPGHLGRVRRHPSVRAGRPARRLCAARRAAARLAVRGHRLCRRQPAAERRLAGRVRRAAGHPRLACGARRSRTAPSA